jgi:hypothetical protein
MIRRACVVLLLRSFWIQMVLSLWSLYCQKIFYLSRKAYLTSSFWLDGLTDPGRSVAYRTTHVFGFRRLILGRDHQKILVRELRGLLLCDEAYEPSLSLDLLVPSWSRGLVCGRSFRERQLHPCGVIFLALQQNLRNLKFRIYVVRL